MSVSIYWRPTSDKGKCFRSGTSENLNVLEETFGNEITASDVTALRAMAKASKNEFYDEVADTVEQIGAITFWGEY